MVKKNVDTQLKSNLSVDKKVKKTEKIPSKQSGFVLSVLGKGGKKVGTVTLPKEIFGETPNEALVAQAIRVYLANQRIGGASTKTRGEVRGSTKKIYRQKGTGRARHGAITAPLFVGGGITFGPRTRDFSLKLSKRMKRKALFSVLSSKFQNEKILVIDSSFIEGKTKNAMGILKDINVMNKKNNADKVLFVSLVNGDIKRAFKNIKGVIIESPELLNTYEVLNSNYLVFDKDSVDTISESFLEKEKKEIN